MGSAGRSEITTLNDAISQEIIHDFYQLLRVFESYYPDCSLLNNSLHKLPLSLAPAAEISFPAADICVNADDIANIRAINVTDIYAIENHRYELSYSNKISNNSLELQLNFMGLYGVDTSLPHYWMEHALRIDTTGKIIRAFLNIFNQRVYTLLYLAWKKHQAIVQIEQGEKGYLNYLQAISGQSLNFTDTIEYAYAGLLGQRAHNATTLAALLSHYLEGVLVSVRQNVPRWIIMESITQLSHDPAKRIRIGDNILLGKRVLDISSQINITIGPITNEAAFKLLSLSKDMPHIVHLISRYCGPFYVFTIQLIVMRDNMSCLILGRDEIRLGWLSWLGCALEKMQLINVHF